MNRGQFLRIGVGGRDTGTHRLEVSVQANKPVHVDSHPVHVDSHPKLSRLDFLKMIFVAILTSMFFASPESRLLAQSVSNLDLSNEELQNKIRDIVQQWLQNNPDAQSYIKEMVLQGDAAIGDGTGEIISEDDMRVLRDFFKHKSDDGDGHGGIVMRESFFDDPDATSNIQSLIADLMGAGTFGHAISKWVKFEQISVYHFIALTIALALKYNASNRHKQEHIDHERHDSIKSFLQMMGLASVFKGEFIKSVDFKQYSDDQLILAMAAIGHIIAPLNTTFGASTVVSPILQEISERQKNQFELSDNQMFDRLYQQFLHTPNFTGPIAIGDYPFLKVMSELGFVGMLRFQVGNIFSGIDETLIDSWIFSFLYQLYQLCPPNLSINQKIKKVGEIIRDKNNRKIVQDLFSKITLMGQVTKVFSQNPVTTGTDVVKDAKILLAPAYEDLLNTLYLFGSVLTGNKEEAYKIALWELIQPLSFRQTVEWYIKNNNIDKPILHSDVVKEMFQSSDFWNQYRTIAYQNGAVNTVDQGADQGKNHFEHLQHEIIKFWGGMFDDQDKIATDIKNILCGKFNLDAEESKKLLYQIACDINEGQYDSAATKVGKLATGSNDPDIDTDPDPDGLPGIFTKLKGRALSFRQGINLNDPKIMFQLMQYFFAPSHIAERTARVLGTTSAEMLGVLPMQMGAIVPTVDLLARFEVFVEIFEPILGKVRAKAYFSAMVVYIISSVAENYTGYVVGVETAKKMIGPMLGQNPYSLRIDFKPMKPLFTTLYYLAIAGGASNLLGDFGPNMALITPMIDKSKGFPSVGQSFKANAKNSTLFGLRGILKLESSIAKIENYMEGLHTSSEADHDQDENELNTLLANYFIELIIKAQQEGNNDPKLQRLLVQLKNNLHNGGVTEEDFKRLGEIFGKSE